LTPEAALNGKPPGFRLVGWSADYVRSLELGICRDDSPDEVAHGLVFTLQVDKQGNRKPNISDSVGDRLAENATWVVGLTLDDIETARQRTAES
jgi:hypothetical protein